MMRRRFRSVELTAPPAKSGRPRAISDGDPRFFGPGLAEQVLGGYQRFNVDLTLAPQPWPTHLAEYIIPELVQSSPTPQIIVEVNRTIVYPLVLDSPDDDPGGNVPDGDFWLFRVTIDDGDGLSHVEQRIRLGHITDIQEPLRVRATIYIVDFTIDEDEENV